MNGKTLAAGAVAGLHHVKNPITLARAVMEKSPHVMMIGDGAEKFAARTETSNSLIEKYFWTQERWDALQKILKEEKEKAEKEKVKSQKQNLSMRIIRNPKNPQSCELPYNKFGTVGAVALDKDGNLAAGTSTGGMTNKKYGRVGDAPIIGAGTYAQQRHLRRFGDRLGRVFYSPRRRPRHFGVDGVPALRPFKLRPIRCCKKVQKLGGDGGVIAMDKFGNMGISFNSEGMYRGIHRLRTANRSFRFTRIKRLTTKYTKNTKMRQLISN